MKRGKLRLAARMTRPRRSRSGPRQCWSANPLGRQPATAPARTLPVRARTRTRRADDTVGCQYHAIVAVNDGRHGPPHPQRRQPTPTSSSNVLGNNRVRSRHHTGTTRKTQLKHHNQLIYAATGPGHCHTRTRNPNLYSDKLSTSTSAIRIVKDLGQGPVSRLRPETGVLPPATCPLHRQRWT